MAKKLTTEEFIQKAKTIHGEKYDYSMVQYCGAHTKVKIICPVHGEFEQLPSAHYSGQGCKKCHELSQFSSLTSFVKKANETHGFKYDYTKSVYTHSKQKLIIICSIHGEFLQAPNPHLKGAGCPICKKETLSKLHVNSLEDFITNAEKVHGNKYDYSSVNYISSKIPVNIICPRHGIFKQQPYSHCNGRGCNKCKMSHAIRDFIKLLEHKNIEYVLEYKFDECRNVIPLPFDIFIVDLNLCIEYDGRQHFEPVEHWGGISGLEATQRNDGIKNQYCKENNINLLRIRYDEDHVSVLKEYFKNNFNIEL